MRKGLRKELAKFEFQCIGSLDRFSHRVSMSVYLSVCLFAVEVGGIFFLKQCNAI